MVGKRVKKFGQGPPPPPFSGNARKKTFFFSGGLPLCHIVKFCKFPQDRKQKLIEACRKGDTDMVAVVEISPTKLLLCIMCLSMCSSFHFYSIFQIEMSNSFQFNV